MTRVGLRRLLTGAACAALVILAAGFVLRRALAPPAPPPVPPRGAVFENVTVVHPGAGRDTHRTVRIEGERIASLEASAGTEPEGGFLLPGLIDMHVHQADPEVEGQTALFALLYLAHGVTTVRDTGGWGPHLVFVREAVRAGAFPGPRLFGCGRLHDGEPPIWPFSHVVKTREEGIAAARAAADQGWSCVKVYERLSPEALAGLRQGARERGLPLIGHVPARVAFEDAGLDEVQHLRGVVGRTPGDPDYPRRVEEQVAQREQLSPERIAQAVRVSLAQGVAHTPTLVMYAHSTRLHRWREQVREPVVRLLPRFYAESTWNPSGMPWFESLAPDLWSRSQASFPRLLEIVRALHEAGVPIYTGTDVGNPFLVPGASLHEELHLLVSAGLSPEQAWAAASARPGKSLPEPGLGTIAAGAPADLLLFREDPTRDLRALSTLEAVVADGRRYERALLDAAVSRAEDLYRGRLYDTVSMAVASRRRDQALKAAVAAAASKQP